MLNIEVIKFEAQDVITTSTAKCTCDSGTSWEHGTDSRNPNVNGVDHTRGKEPCYADEHPNCYPIM